MPILPVVFSIDAEPDLRQPEPGLPVGWAGWDAARNLLAAWRAQVATVSGRAAPFGWYLRMDPQIEALHGDAAYLAMRDRHFWADCERRRDEIGVHNHAHRWDAAQHKWIIDHGNAAWVDHVVDLGCATYRRAFGRRLRSFRFGDGFLSDAALVRLARRGVRYDLSLEPGLHEMTGFHASETSTGTLPDRRAAPRAPYRPHRSDFRRPTRIAWRPLWVLPISTAPPPPGYWPDYAYLPMNLAHPPRPTAQMFDWLLAERASPFVVLALRAGDLADRQLAANIEANLAMLLAHPRAGDFAFMTPAGFVGWHRHFGQRPNSFVKTPGFAANVTESNIGNVPRKASLSFSKSRSMNSPMTRE